MKRKALLTGIFSAVFFAVAGITLYAQTTSADKTNMIKVDYGTEYYNETVRVLNLMWDKRKDQIDKISERAAAILRAGHKVVWDCTAGHSNISECRTNAPLPAERRNDFRHGVQRSESHY